MTLFYNEVNGLSAVEGVPTTPATVYYYIILHIVWFIAYGASGHKKRGVRTEITRSVLEVHVYTYNLVVGCNHIQSKIDWVRQ